MNHLLLNFGRSRLGCVDIGQKEADFTAEGAKIAEIYLVFFSFSAPSAYSAVQILKSQQNLVECSLPFGEVAGAKMVREQGMEGRFENLALAAG